MTADDWKNTNEFGDIGFIEGTRYWFKRDIQTMGSALKKTIKYSPVFIAISLLFSLGLSYYYFSGLRVDKIMVYIVIFYPLSAFAYFLFYIMVNKGYNIRIDTGTSIDTSRNPKPEN